MASVVWGFTYLYKFFRLLMLCRESKVRDSGILYPLPLFAESPKDQDEAADSNQQWDQLSAVVDAIELGPILGVRQHDFDVQDEKQHEDAQHPGSDQPALTLPRPVAPTARVGGRRRSASYAGRPRGRPWGTLLHLNLTGGRALGGSDALAAESFVAVIAVGPM